MIRPPKSGTFVLKLDEQLSTAVGMIALYAFQFWQDIDSIQPAQAEIGAPGDLLGALDQLLHGSKKSDLFFFWLQNDAQFWAPQGGAIAARWSPQYIVTDEFNLKWPPPMYQAKVYPWAPFNQFVLNQPNSKRWVFHDRYGDKRLVRVRKMLSHQAENPA